MNSDIKYCRICLDKNFVGQSIFETYNCRSLTDIVMTISGIEIYKMDKFSQLICFNCAGLLVKAFEIHEKCIKSNKILHQYNGLSSIGTFSSEIPLLANENINYDERFTPVIHNVNDDNSNKTTTEELWRKIIEESSEMSEQFSNSFNNDSIEKEFDEFIANLISDTDDNDISNGSLNNKDDNNGSSNSTGYNYYWEISSPSRKNINNINNDYYDIEGERKNITTTNNNKKNIIKKTKTNNYNNKIYECEHCMKIIINRTAYERHKRYHLQQIKQEQHQQQQQNNNIINHNTLPCSICQKYVTHKSNLKRHLLLVHRNQKMDLICSKCNQIFIEPNELFEHLKTHEVIYSNCNKNDKSCGNNDNNNNCICSDIQINEIASATTIYDSNNNNQKIKKLDNSFNRQQHEDETESEYIIECKLCKNYKTVSLTLYTQHMRIKHQISDTKPFKCRICQMSFASKQGMLRHIDNIHENNRKNLRNREKKFLCNTCGKFFYTNFHLDIHIRSHTGEKPFKCKYCKKTFAQMSGLRMHTLTHTGEKPFACKICGKSFTQYGHVKEHHLIHSNEKNHVCNVCGHSFRVKGNLTAHMLVHSGKKPFSCGHCGKEFIQRTKLRAHVSKFHQPEEYSDDYDDSNSYYDVIPSKASSICGSDGYFLDEDIEAAADKIIEEQNIQLQIYDELEKNEQQQQQIVTFDKY